MSGGKPRHRLPVPELADVMVLGAAEARHLGVLRLAPGAAVVVFDGRGGEARATVADLDDTRAVLHRGEATQGAQETPHPLTLAASLLKGDKLAEVVRAATELGVARIQLVVPRRADAREIGAQKLQRLARVAQEASKQSRRAVIPEVLAPISLDALTWEGTLLVAQPGSAVRVADAVDWTRPVTVLTGPEGGLTAEEVAALVARGAQAITLGPRILRAETAPVALLGAIAALGQ